MSSYEDYSRTSANYDETRAAVGVEIILGCLASGRRPLQDLVLLDAGCGTGNYTRAVVEHVKEIIAVDSNAGMLSVAAAKLASQTMRRRARFTRASIVELPIEDACLDGIMINQVLHHLPEAGATGRPMVRRVFKECSRVLKPGGRLIINTCATEQIRRGFWYYALIPSANERTLESHLPLGEMKQLLSDCGLQPRGSFVPVDALMQGARYFDVEGPSLEAWRNGDSSWAKVSSEELALALARHSELREQGRLVDFMRQHDELRKSIGQLTFLCAENTPQKTT